MISIHITFRLWERQLAASERKRERVRERNKRVASLDERSKVKDRCIAKRCVF